MLSLSDHIAHKTYKTAADRGITCLFAEATVKNFFRKALISRVFDHLWNARLIQTWDRSLKWVWDYRNRGEFSSPQKATAAGAWNSAIEMYFRLKVHRSRAFPRKERLNFHLFYSAHFFISRLKFPLVRVLPLATWIWCKVLSPDLQWSPPQAAWLRQVALPLPPSPTSL